MSIRNLKNGSPGSERVDRAAPRADTAKTSEVAPVISPAAPQTRFDADAATPKPPPTGERNEHHFDFDRAARIFGVQQAVRDVATMFGNMARRPVLAGMVGLSMMTAAPGSAFGAGMSAQLANAPVAEQVVATRSRAPLATREVSRSAQVLNELNPSELIDTMKPHQAVAVDAESATSARIGDIHELEKWLDVNAPGTKVVVLSRSPSRYADENETNAEGVAHYFYRHADELAGWNDSSLVVFIDREANFVTVLTGSAFDEAQLGHRQFRHGTDTIFLASIENGATLAQASQTLVDQLTFGRERGLDAPSVVMRWKGQQTLDAAAIRLQALPELAADFVTKHPESSIGRVDHRQLSAQLQSAKTALNGTDMRAAFDEAASVAEKIDHAERAITQFPHAEEALSRLRADLDKLGARSHADSGAEQLQNARTALAAAEQALARKDGSYIAQFDAAKEQLDAAAARIARTDLLVNLGTGAAGLALLIGLGLAVLALKRRRYAAQALQTKATTAVGDGGTATEAELRYVKELEQRLAAALARWPQGAAESPAVGRLLNEATELLGQAMRAAGIRADAVSQAAALLSGGTLERARQTFDGGDAQQAVQLLKDAPLELSPEVVTRLFGTPDNDLGRRVQARALAQHEAAGFEALARAFGSARAELEPLTGLLTATRESNRGRLASLQQAADSMVLLSKDVRVSAATRPLFQAALAQLDQVKSEVGLGQLPAPEVAEHLESTAAQLRRFEQAAASELEVARRAKEAVPAAQAAEAKAKAWVPAAHEDVKLDAAAVAAAAARAESALAKNDFSAALKEAQTATRLVADAEDAVDDIERQRRRRQETSSYSTTTDSGWSSTTTYGGGGSNDGFAGGSVFGGGFAGGGGGFGGGGAGGSW